MRTGSFNNYECCIRYCWYTLKHNSAKWYNIKGWLALLGYLGFFIPFVVYYKITKKELPDLELF